MTAARSGPGSLCVVGTGIRAVSQITAEAQARIRSAERLHYSVCDFVSEQWLRECNPRAESLADLYVPGEPRLAIYERMVQRVLASVRQGHATCLALYGHPGVCARAGHDSIAQARAEGLRATMLPGVSCEDCLFADLGVDPASQGVQSHEATVFLQRQTRFDPRSALVLWQVGLLGDDHYRLHYQAEALPSLVQQLLPAYGPSHEVVLYEVQAYGSFEPLIQRLALSQLHASALNWATTLYVPPRA